MEDSSFSTVAPCTLQTAELQNAPRGYPGAKKDAEISGMLTGTGVYEESGK